MCPVGGSTASVRARNVKIKPQKKEITLPSEVDRAAACPVSRRNQGNPEEVFLRCVVFLYSNDVALTTHTGRSGVLVKTSGPRVLFIV